MKHVDCKPSKPLFTYRKCVNEKKQEVLDFFAKHVRMPRKGAATRAEHCLAVVWGHYINPSVPQYDPVFSKHLQRIGAYKPYDSDQKKADVLNFIKEAGKAPKRSRTGYKGREHVLGVWLRNFTDKKTYAWGYDPKFARQVKKLLKV